MKEETKKKRDKWLHVRLDEDELKQLKNNFSKTTEHKLSSYARKIILAQPLVIRHRNSSLDELLALLAKVQKDLHGVANNYNQMLHKLHLLRDEKDIRTWVAAYEMQKKELFDNIAEMKDQINQGAKKWLR